jgi:antitoxin component of MazEF toxin-antitoxin module
MKKRQFDAQIRKVGNSYVVTVPSKIIKRFKIKEKKFLTVTIEDE